MGGDDVQHHEEQENQPKWHLEKSISITHIIATVSAIISLAVVGSHFDTRLSILERELVYRDQVDTKQQKEIDNFRRDVKEDLVSINNKLDKIIESRQER